MVFKLDVSYLAFFIMAGGLANLIMQIITYFKLNFSFELPDRAAFKEFTKIMLKFLPCIISMSIIEINLIIDARMASYLPAGSVSMLNYAFAFTRIAIGVFAVAFSNVLLPYFSRVTSYAPKRLGFYIFEATKLTFWITIPIAIVMCFFSQKIFYTLFFCEKFGYDKTVEAGLLLVAFLLGLFFFSLNKILLSVYYSLHHTLLPTIISIIGATSNLALNVMLMPYLKAFGLALSTSIAAGIQTILFLIVLNKKFNINFYGARFLDFVSKASIQLGLFAISVISIYSFLNYIITIYFIRYAQLLLNGYLLWAWVAPIIITLFWLLYKTRKFFKIKLYFLD